MALQANHSRLHGNRQAMTLRENTPKMYMAYLRRGRCTGPRNVRMVASNTKSFPPPVETRKTQSTAVSTTTTALAQPQADSFSRSFEWLSYWYPVQVLSSTDPNRPHAVELLGKQLVLWRDGQGKWCCMDDACPHRLAPLSEGRLESDGTLQCSYHGWRFNGRGRCTEIPQAIDDKAKAAACSSSRSCVASYPVRESCGLIWVWPTAGPAAEAAAAAAPTPLSRVQIADWTAGTVRGQWYRRELPYSWDVLIENLTDPSHLPWSHHNLTPILQRSKGVVPMPFTAIYTPSGDGSEDEAAKPGNLMEHQQPLAAYEFPSVMAVAGCVAFTPPIHVTYEYSQSPLNRVGVWQDELIGVPAGPGRSVAYTIARSDAPRIQAKDLVKALFTNPKTVPMLCTRYYYQNQPKYKLHLTLNKLFDQDSVFLNMQDRQLALRGKASWSKDYYMPTQADGLVIAGRKWADFALQLPLPGHKSAAAAASNHTPTAADAFSLFAAEASLTQPASPQEIGDRYNQHTRHCTVCQKALQGFERKLQLVQAATTGLVLAVVGVVAGLIVPGLIAATQSTSGIASVAGALVPGAALAAAAGLAALLAWKAAAATADSIAAFKYVEFSHADNH